MAASFPPEYMAAVFFGNGLAGIGSNCIREITLLVWKDEPYTSVLVMYSFAFFVLAGCALA